MKEADTKECVLHNFTYRKANTDKANLREMRTVIALDKGQ